MFDLKHIAGIFVLVTALIGVSATLVAVADVNSAPAASAVPDEAAIKRGKLMFLQCRACHEVAAGQTHKVWPNLRGFMGRRAAHAEGFVYSDALSASALVWDPTTLDRWIKHPESVVPGTTMAFVGIENPTDRRALIAYLESVTR